MEHVILRSYELYLLNIPQLFSRKICQLKAQNSLLKRPEVASLKKFPFGLGDFVIMQATISLYDLR